MYVLMGPGVNKTSYLYIIDTLRILKLLRRLFYVYLYLKNIYFTEEGKLQGEFPFQEALLKIRL